LASWKAVVPAKIRLIKLSIIEDSAELFKLAQRELESWDVIPAKAGIQWGLSKMHFCPAGFPPSRE
jgi:hypothetical protein